MAKFSIMLWSSNTNGLVGILQINVFGDFFCGFLVGFQFG